MKRRLRIPSGRKRRRLTAEPLEARRVLAASFGWDGPGLGGAELTYTVGNAPSSISQAEARAAIETAFNAWASVVDISFTEVNQTGLRDSIDITFRNIDGRGGILAQAYFPDDVNPARIAGDIEFDLSESWEVGNSKGSRAFDLAWVATHEIGHSLGLDHSRDPGAVLAAYVSPNQRFVALDNDDISEIQQLYAASSGSAASSTPAEQTPPEQPTVAEPADPVTPNEPSDPTDNDSGNNDSSDNENDPFRRWRWWWRWGGFWSRWGGRATADTPENHNPDSPTDANDDGSTSAVDALVIINHLNRNTASGTGFYDVNGDGTISAADALMVINKLARKETTPANEEAATDDGDETGAGDPDLQNDVADPVDDGELPTDDNDVDDSMDDGEGHRHHHRFGGRHFLGRHSERLFNRFDTDGNQAISEDEVTERLWQRLVDKNIDADGDGSITRKELDDYPADQRAERFARKDSDESGSLTQDEVSPRFWDKVVAADTNQDDTVTLEELEIWLAERRTEVPEADSSEEDQSEGEDLGDEELDQDELDEEVADEAELDEEGLDEGDCPAERMDDEESESENLRLVQRRSDRLFAQLGRRTGRQ